MINCVFFLVYPSVACCRCFEADGDIARKTTKMKSFLVTQEYAQLDSGNDDSDDQTDWNELAELLKSSENYAESGIKKDIPGKYGEKEQEKDTKFVMSALEESRESLELLVSSG